MIEKLNLFVIGLSKGKRISKTLTNTLDPVDIGTISQFIVASENPTELHYHDYDEYWFFTEGKTNVTLRLSDGTKKEFEVGLGDLVVTPKHVEHGHIPYGTVKGIQWTGETKSKARTGHLYRDLK
jgi:mannose-6-phosphate isomerase-like protein (cupin superfamily)